MEYEEPEEVRIVGIPYILTIPFQGTILALEWTLFSFFFQKDSMTNAAMFGVAFVVHLLLFIWRRAVFLKEENVRLDPAKTILPIAAFVLILVLIYVGVGKFIVPITS